MRKSSKQFSRRGSTLAALLTLGLLLTACVSSDDAPGGAAGEAEAQHSNGAVPGANTDESGDALEDADAGDVDDVDTDSVGEADGVGSDRPASQPGPTEVIASGFAAPWSIAFYGDVPLVSQRDSAQILELNRNSLRARQVAVLDGVDGSGEGGLLGIAVWEDYLYAYFTAGSENRIERYQIGGSPGALTLQNPELVLGGISAASYHNGGRIAFGPDGMLYATTGDAGDTQAAQDLGSLAGKILRLTPEGAIPGDNPFPNSPVYSYGHRNPQGIAWDPAGTMYASEFGQNTWDELNVIVPGGNYGWPTVEGIAGRDGIIDPVQQWEPSAASPSGIAVTGEAILVANLRGERLRKIPLDALSKSEELHVGEYGRLRDVVAAPDGSFWVLTNNTDGRGTPAEGDDRLLRVRPV